ncbi:MAG TPA: cupin domain-containing protein [Ktedonobacterales bacterium]|jgi:mannose-6-phosphate isomerase-like protein (cupin superfamily)|nr:cupin domain-containing protein [Ktedonobacterales bacterium]
MPMEKWHRADQPTAIAPDGAEIRGLIDREQGATRLSVAEALLHAGERTAKVRHVTVYEEIWYVLQGMGMFHLHRPDARSEETAPVGRGDAVLVPVRHGFWMENTGATDLIWLCCGSPPWPGAQEAQPWPSDEREEGANRGSAGV